MKERAWGSVDHCHVVVVVGEVCENVLLCLKMVLFVVRSERKDEMEREVARLLMLRLQRWGQSQPVLDGGTTELGGGRVFGTRNHSECGAACSWLQDI
jgi:hypothetical protein